MRDLTEVEKTFVYIPASILLDEKNNQLATALICYLQIRQGRDGISLFSISDAVEWLGRKQNFSARGINGVLFKTLCWLKDEGYIQVIGEMECKRIIKARVLVDELYARKIGDKKCKYAVLFLDEIDKILQTNGYDGKPEVYLLVLSWLRMMICRRKSYGDGREQLPEMTYSYLKHIAEHLNVSEKGISNAVNALHEMKIIYMKHSDKYRCGDRWRHHVTFFCNYYRRDGKKLTAYGEEYYEAEIQAGEMMIKNRMSYSKGFEQYGNNIEIIEQY